LEVVKGENSQVCAQNDQLKKELKDKSMLEDKMKQLEKDTIRVTGEYQKLRKQMDGLKADKALKSAQRPHKETPSKQDTSEVQYSPADVTIVPGSPMPDTKENLRLEDLNRTTLDATPGDRRHYPSFKEKDFRLKVTDEKEKVVFNGVFKDTRDQQMGGSPGTRQNNTYDQRDQYKYNDRPITDFRKLVGNKEEEFYRKPGAIYNRPQQ
jgi:hypothetical protein